MGVSLQKLLQNLKKTLNLSSFGSAMRSWLVIFGQMRVIIDCGKWGCGKWDCGKRTDLKKINVSTRKFAQNKIKTALKHC